MEIISQWANSPISENGRRLHLTNSSGAEYYIDVPRKACESLEAAWSLRPQFSNSAQTSRRPIETAIANLEASVAVLNPPNSRQTQAQQPDWLTSHAPHHGQAAVTYFNEDDSSGVPDTGFQPGLFAPTQGTFVPGHDGSVDPNTAFSFNTFPPGTYSHPPPQSGLCQSQQPSFSPQVNVAASTLGGTYLSDHCPNYPAFDFPTQALLNSQQLTQLTDYDFGQ